MTIQVYLISQSAICGVAAVESEPLFAVLLT